MSTKTISIPAPLVPAAAPASAAETAGAPSIEHVRRRTVSNTGTETGGALDPVNRRPPRFPYGSAKAPIWRREWIDLAGARTAARIGASLNVKGPSERRA